MYIYIFSVGMKFAYEFKRNPSMKMKGVTSSVV